MSTNVTEREARQTQILDRLEQIGATDWNGTTWFDRTNYFETLTATDENLEFALKMEADRLVNEALDG